MWLRLRQIALVAGELAPAVDDLQDILGLEVCFRDPGVAHFGLENALLPVGDQFIEVVAPTQEGTAGGRYLERRSGDGGYMVITQCDDHAPRRRRVEALGVRLAHQFEMMGRFKNMQMHPKDTGGSFFEIDEQLGVGAYDRDGPWEPAGGAGWKSAQRTGRVRGIAAAELQVADPAGVAARWAEIAEVPVTRDAAGNPQVELENAAVRFVPCSDGRPDGLGGLDLHVADRDAILES
ncbi:MAG: VOC family protein, partial [Deltaproteobacteria bacterium]|nr:VOC family protein [Deltaproteobacteria bacterium]